MDLYIDISKALNRARLVKKQVQVHGKNGKMFTRMQWVDPNTGQAVMEDRHPDSLQHEDHHMVRVGSLTPEQRMNVARRYYGDDSHRAENFAYHTHIPFHREGSYEGTLRHISENLHKVPHHQIKEHLDNEIAEAEYQSKKRENMIQPNQPPLGLKHTDHNLPESVVKHRHGEFGPIDMRRLFKGTKAHEHPFVQGELDYVEKKQEDPFHIKYNQRGKTLDPYEHFKSIFGDITHEGLEHVFSVPDLGLTGKLSGVSMYMNEGHIQTELNFDFHTDSNIKMGSITRIFHRDEKGHLHVDNSYFKMNGAGTKLGAASHIYARQEQLYRHLSHGHPVHIQVSANISVGKYAWALKGFTFKDEDKGPRRMAKELREFCNDNEVELSEVLDHSGYKDVRQLEHPWEFAALQDGADWLLGNLQGAYVDDDVKRDVEGVGHFGKAFMLGGVNYWEGMRVLNNDSLEEEVYDPLKKYVR